MTTSSRRRQCLRCGTKETLRDYGNVRGWEEAVVVVPARK
jgi:hypothetical protein